MLCMICRIAAGILPSAHLDPARFMYSVGMHSCICQLDGSHRHSLSITWWCTLQIVMLSVCVILRDVPQMLAGFY